MIYRMRIYQAVSANLPAFHDFFRTHLLPIQQRHGARRSLPPLFTEKDEVFMTSTLTHDRAIDHFRRSAKGN